MTDFTDSEKALIEVWEAHTSAEFEQKDADAAIATSGDRRNRESCAAEVLRRNLYSAGAARHRPEIAYAERRAEPHHRRIYPPLLRFTHTVRMDWFAPGIEPTGRRLAVPHVGVIAFEGGKISSEHIYWDQAAVLAQMGLLNGELPVIGAAQCDRLLDADAPVNQLIQRLTPDG